MFETLKTLPPDAIIGIMAMFREDPNPEKIDLSVGVYQDESGVTPVLESVRRAEQEILAGQTTKTYVGIAGNPQFNKAVEALMLGAEHPARAAGRVATVQTPGGSGGLSVAAHLLQRAKPGARVWFSDPSWPNHFPLLRTAGLATESYPYYDATNHGVAFDAMLDRFDALECGDVVLLHGCCHNPCGADLTPAQWQTLADLFAERGVIPFIDLAYQGLSESLDADAYGLRLMAERLPEVVAVASCSKNLGLYRERTGATAVVARDAEQAKVALSNLSNVARSIYSMPPDHGAAIAARVLTDEALRALWVSELGGMRDRINGLRSLLVSKLEERNAPRDFSFIARERGMFSFLGISREQVVRLRERYHLYMVESSRINVAGINLKNVDRIADAVVAVL